MTDRAIRTRLPPSPLLPGAESGAEAHRSAIPWAAFGLAALFLASIAPIALNGIPAMVDYPNHLARMSVLMRAGTPAANPFYDVAWAPYPNLAMDLIVPPLGRLVGIETATRLFYVLCQILVVAGAMTLAYVVRRRVLGAGFVACLMLYYVPFAWGFMNFQFALGLALFGFAAWIALAGQPLVVRCLAHAVVVAILCASHLFALGLYGVAIGIWQLWDFRRSWPGLPRAAALTIGMAMPVAAIALAVALAGGSVGGHGTIWLLGSKLFWLGALNGFSREASAAVTLLVAVALAIALGRGWLRFVGPGAWLAASFGLLFLAMPFRLLDTGFVDGRVVIFALLALPAFITCDAPPGPARTIAGGLLAMAAFANLAAVAWVQIGHGRTYQTLLRTLEAMPRGARLLVTDREGASDPPTDLRLYTLYHAGTLAVHTRDAFVPTLFTYPGKQPIRPKREVAPITLLEGGPIPLAILKEVAAGQAPPQRLDYVRSWTRDFDYLLLLHPDGPPPMPGTLERVGGDHRLALYRIVPGSKTASTRP